MSASQILSGTPAALAVNQLGVLTDPVRAIVADPGNLTISETQAVGSSAGVLIATNTQGADCSLYQSATDGAGANHSWRWCVGGTAAGGIVPHDYQLFHYLNGAFENESLRISAADGVVQFAEALQCGVATIGAGTASIAVVNAAIGASSVVLLTPQLNDATAVRVAAVINPGVGFTITAPANATAALPVSWFIARY